MIRIGLLSIAVLLSTPLARAAEYSGPAVHVRDGDTFVMRAASVLVAVRLCGVDSPESGHHGYHKAKVALAEFGSRKNRPLHTGRSWGGDTLRPPLAA
jgi:endonuclease YncB( thermonuclease family)